jgi:hypothetical protein
MSMVMAVMPSRWAGHQGGPEAVQTRLLAVVRQVRAPGSLQIGYDRQIQMPLADGLLIDPEPGAYLGAPSRQGPP